MSYFEWVQDRHGYFWELEDVNLRLEKKMREAFDDVLQTSLKYKVDLRTAAYIVAISRVGMVTKMRECTRDVRSKVERQRSCYLLPFAPCLLT